MLPSLGASEAKKIGITPLLTFTIKPYYFSTGIAAGSGEFYNTAFSSPDSIVVDWQSVSGYWVSPILIGNLETWPANVEIFFESNSPGYEIVTHYRTSNDSQDILLESWSALVSGNSYSFQKYYQWRIVWLGVRAFAYDAQSSEADAAWALDSYDPEDEYQSYATDGTGTVASLSDAAFMGDYVIPDRDILDGGELTLESPEDFSDIISGEHTLVLANPPYNAFQPTVEARYSPGHVNFIFRSEDDWYLKNILVHFRYTDSSEPVLLYEGVILSWGPVAHGVDESGKFEPHTVEIYSRNKISFLMDTKLGVPDQDGTPNPLVYGINFAQAEQLTSKMIGDPEAVAKFESGTFAELSSTDAANGGTVSISSELPFEGNYCMRASVVNANAKAVGMFSMSSGYESAYFSCRIRVVSFPESPGERLACILEVRGKDNIGNPKCLKILVGYNGKLWADFNGAQEELDVYIDSYAGSWKHFAVGVKSGTPGKVRLWIDGNEEFGSDEYHFGSTQWSHAIVGVSLGNVAEAYILEYDKLEFWSSWYANMYQINGWPYESIDAVLVDGSLKVQGQKGPGKNVVSRVVAGRKSSADTIQLYPEYGTVVFTDDENLPKGTVTIRASKDSNTHPVDIIQEIITAAGCGDYIDATSFAAAKAALPNDEIYAVIEDMSAADALREICSRCLILLWMDQDKIRIKAYTGSSPSSSVFAIDESLLHSLAETVDMQNLITRVSVKYGWYESNKQLYYETINESLEDKIGKLNREIDLSWGAPVVTEGSLIARNKADWLMARLRGGVSRIEASGVPQYLARLEIGDNVTVNSPFVRYGEIYTVYKKTLSLSPPYGVELVLCKFLGE